MNFREHLTLFLGNRGETPISFRKQGNRDPPPPWEALLASSTVDQVPATAQGLQGAIEAQNNNNNNNNNNNFIIIYTKKKNIRLPRK